MPVLSPTPCILCPYFATPSAAGISPERIAFIVVVVVVVHKNNHNRKFPPRALIAPVLFSFFSNTENDMNRTRKKELDRWIQFWFVAKLGEEIKI